MYPMLPPWKFSSTEVLPFSIMVVYYYFTINLPNFNNPLVARGSEQKKGDRSRSTYYHFFSYCYRFYIMISILRHQKRKKGAFLCD